MISVVVIIAIPSYATMRHKSYSNLWLIGETKSWINNTETVPQMFVSKSCSTEILQINGNSHTALWSQKRFAATLLKFTFAWVLRQRAATFAKLIPMRKSPWKTTSDDEIHVIFYYEQVSHKSLQNNQWPTTKPNPKLVVKTTKYIV